MIDEHRCRNAYILATRDNNGNPARMVIFPDEERSIVLGDFDDTLAVPLNPPLVQYLDEIQATAIWQAVKRLARACDSTRRGSDDDIAAYHQLAALVLAPNAAGYEPETLAA